ncbi:hypothetical protein GF312_16865 [Candidatus Poribacteria bacterium]|nr:hypothetical protein [Candidatus Poribacteria bacterium]
MKISEMSMDQAGKLSDIYNQQVADIPHCYPLSPGEFKTGIISRNESAELKSEVIFTSDENGQITGFSHAAIVEFQKNGTENQEGLIRFLTYKSGCRNAGQALLEKSEEYLKGMGMDTIKAFRISYAHDTHYQFYHLGFGLVSDRAGHIPPLFLINGYEITGGEVFMERPHYQITEPEIPNKAVEILIEENPGNGTLPGLNVRAVKGEYEVGICKSFSVGEHSQSDEAQNWFFIKWLGVAEQEWRKGWGKYLLQKTLWEMKRIGYKNSIISANMINYRARLFYTNYGYKVADTAYEFTKSL